MNAIDCLVHHLVGTEAFTGVVLEAFACGRPMIASALDGIPEVFGATGEGRLVAPESVEELVAAMSEWAARPRFEMAQRQQMHRQIKDRFSLPIVAQRVKELYERLMTPESVTELTRC
jgi:glycosyltransferase involved in cell wall biosynthesis